MKKFQSKLVLFYEDGNVGYHVKPLNGKILIKIKLVMIFFFLFNPDGI